MIPLPRIEASPRILPISKKVAEPRGSGRSNPKPPSRELTGLQKDRGRLSENVQVALITKEKT